MGTYDPSKALDTTAHAFNHDMKPGRYVISRAKDADVIFRIKDNRTITGATRQLRDRGHRPLYIVNVSPKRVAYQEPTPSGGIIQALGGIMGRHLGL